ncbi:hypothetical protein P7K49_001104, partial [Saguinus oedipus]
HHGFYKETRSDCAATAYADFPPAGGLGPPLLPLTSLWPGRVGRRGAAAAADFSRAAAATDDNDDDFSRAAAATDDDDDDDDDDDFSRAAAAAFSLAGR